MVTVFLVRIINGQGTPYMTFRDTFRCEFCIFVVIYNDDPKLALIWTIWGHSNSTSVGKDTSWNSILHDIDQKNDGKFFVV